MEHDINANKPFWRNLRSRGNAAAIVDADRQSVLTYAELADDVERTEAALRVDRKALILLFAAIDAASIVFYLAALEGGHAIFLSPLSISHPGAVALIERYRPDFVLVRAGAQLENYQEEESLNGYRVYSRLRICDPPPHPVLALLLSTSGSTGNPKAVRLSTNALCSGARQVARALAIHSTDRALQCLPFSYVYGLTVLNSALYAGAAVVLVSGTPAEQSYWTRANRADVTTIAAVSLTFEIMRSLNVDGRSLPKLSRLTHSGDALNADLFRWVHAHFNASLYLMYGQTEAGGRMTVLPPHYLPEARGSVGRAIPGSRISLDANGEIVFCGPGVMLGYAEQREDLELGDVLNGVLRTGDIGKLDSRDLLHITGRVSRHCKITGKRISLDEVEAFLGATIPAAAVAAGSEVIVFIEERNLDTHRTRMTLASHFQVPPQNFRLVSISRLPRGDRGKVAYEALRSML